MFAPVVHDESAEETQDDTNFGPITKMIGRLQQGGGSVAAAAAAAAGEGNDTASKTVSKDMSPMEKAKLEQAIAAMGSMDPELLKSQMQFVDEKLKASLTPKAYEIWNEQKENILKAAMLKTPQVTSTLVDQVNDMNMAVLQSIKTGDLKSLIEALKTANMTPNSLVKHASDSDPYPLLHWAALEEHVQVLRFLVHPDPQCFPNAPPSKQRLGADINARNHRGETALTWACIRGRMKCIIYLISEGADLNVADEKGFSLMHHAAQQGQVLVQSLLLYHGVDVDLRDSKGRTPLHWAAYNGQIDSVRWLLRHGADPAAEDWQKCLAVHWAALRGYKNVCEALCEKPGGSATLLDREDVTGGCPDKLALEKAQKEPPNSYGQVEFLKVYDYLRRQRLMFCELEPNATFKRRFGRGVQNLRFRYLPKRLPHISWLLWPILAPIGWWQYVTWILPGTGEFYLMHMTFIICFWGKWIAWILLQAKDPGNYVIPIPSIEFTGRSNNNNNNNSNNNNNRYSAISAIDPSSSTSTRDDLEAGTSSTTALHDFRFASIPNPLLGEKAKIARELYVRVLTEGLDLPVCSSDEIVKLPRSKHDRVTDVCIDKFDHFCPWMNAAIGSRNYRDFFFTALFATIAMLIWIVLIVAYTMNFNPEGSFWANMKATGLGWQLWAWFYGLLALYGCMMTGSHIWLTAKNLSTNEMMNGFRYRYLQKNQNPFSQGLFMNFMEMLGFIEPKKMDYYSYFDKELAGEVRTGFVVEEQHHGHSHDHHHHGHSH